MSIKRVENLYSFQNETFLVKRTYGYMAVRGSIDIYNGAALAEEGIPC